MGTIIVLADMRRRKQARRHRSRTANHASFAGPALADALDQEIRWLWTYLQARRRAEQAHSLACLEHNPKHGHPWWEDGWWGGGPRTTPGDVERLLELCLSLRRSALSRPERGAA